MDKTPVITRGGSTFVNPHFSTSKLLLFGSRKGNKLNETSNQTCTKTSTSTVDQQTMFYGKSQQFTNHCGRCGTSRDTSLNTAMDRELITGVNHLQAYERRVLFEHLNSVTAGSKENND